MIRNKLTLEHRVSRLEKLLSRTNCKFEGGISFGDSDVFYSGNPKDYAEFNPSVLRDAVSRRIINLPFNIYASNRPGLNNGKFCVCVTAAHELDESVEANWVVVINNKGKKLYAVYGLDQAGRKDYLVGNANSVDEAAEDIMEDIMRLNDDGWFDDQLDV